MSVFMSQKNKPEPLKDIDIEAVDSLTPEQIQKLLDDSEIDESLIPTSLRGNYKCEKTPTGPFDKKKLQNFIEQQALAEPDIPDIVPHIPGTIRGNKWTAPSKPRPRIDDDIELDLDLGEDVEIALSSATADELVDLAGVMGLHSFLNQDQFNAVQERWDSQPQKDLKHVPSKIQWSAKPDPNIGWTGNTKATPLPEFPDEQPNRTVPEEVLKKVKCNDISLKAINLNNVSVQEATAIELFEALEGNGVVTEVSMANTGLTDLAAQSLANTLEANKSINSVNIESNFVSPQTLVRIFEAINVHQSVTLVKAANQQAKVLGNKVEVAITKAVESNPFILRVGLHLQAGDCRNRMDTCLQRNMDRIRLQRVQKQVGNNYPGSASDNNYSDEE